MTDKLDVKDILRVTKIVHSGPKNATLVVNQGNSPYPVPPPGVTPDWLRDLIKKENEIGQTHS